MTNAEAITLHTRCIHAKRGTGRPIGFHLQAIMRNLRQPQTPTPPALPRLGTHSRN